MSRNFAQIFDGKSSFPRRKKSLPSPHSPVFSYIGFGSNLGSRRKTIERALRELANTPGILLGRVSSLYETEPVGGPPQRPHLNGVIELRTTFSLKRLWGVLKKIERRLGRRRSVRWGPRTLDLDILTYGDKPQRASAVVVPHPRYANRRFVLVPFSEIAPDFRHPLLKLSNRALLRRLTLLGQRVTMLARWKNKRFYPCKKRKS